MKPLDIRGEVGTFVGYNDIFQAWEIWLDNKIVVSRNVRFFENIFMFQKFENHQIDLKFDESDEDIKLNNFKGVESESDDSGDSDDGFYEKEKTYT